MKKRGFFGGSFDPLHFGHISLAIQLLEQHQLDEVLFCPVYCSPFKVDYPPVVSAEHRLKMLEKALQIPQFQISPIEIKRRGVSYTIDTLKELCQDPHQKIFLLMSEKNAEGFRHWKKAEEIEKLAPLLIGTTQIQTSSTEIRARLRKNLYCEHLVPREVLDYIRQHRLYSDG